MTSTEAMNYDTEVTTLPITANPKKELYFALEMSEKSHVKSLKDRSYHLDMACQLGLVGTT